MILGTVPYLNAKPLTAHLPADYFLSELPPVKLAKALLNRHILAGLIPAYGILENRFCAYPEAGVIGCDGAVKSVGFFVKEHLGGPEDISSLYFDQESQTSVALAKIVLTKMFGRNLKSINTVDLQNSPEADALMLIGDKALFFKEPGYRFWDLGELWKQLTGFGFVFAAWASLNPLPQDTVHKLLVARETGCQRLKNQPLEEHKGRELMAHDYLKYNIVYEYTDSLKRGFKQYQDWLEELSLCQPQSSSMVA